MKSFKCYSNLARAVLLDLIDIHVEVPPSRSRTCAAAPPPNLRKRFAARVRRARAVQQGHGFYNLRMPTRAIRKVCAFIDARTYSRLRWPSAASVSPLVRTIAI